MEPAIDFPVLLENQGSEPPEVGLPKDNSVSETHDECLAIK